MQAIAPNKGPRWADAGGNSLDIPEEERKRTENSFNVSTAVFDAPSGKAELKDLSQIESNARPCATDARRPTVHMIAAS